MIIKPNETEYSTWWNKTIQDAGLVDIRYQLKGFFVWMPYGFSVMKNIKLTWDALFAENNIKEMYFPLLVPEEYASKNASWWNSFKEQAFYALGYEDKEKKVFIRPTGEPAMYPMFSTWIRSHRDLPLRIYETVSSFRNETKSTKTFVRDVEIGPWYEIHTAHATREEAEAEIDLAIQMNQFIFNETAVATLKVRKPLSDCFPGSVGAVEFYTALNDKLVENASCNNLGQAYAKAFDIMFVDKDQEKKYAWQTCTGNGERFLAAVVGNHSDEKGLVVPPHIAPIQVSILLINLQAADVLPKLNLAIPKERIEVISVASVSEIGEARFSTERRGIPLRIEIGPREMTAQTATLAPRKGAKVQVSFTQIREQVTTMLEALQKTLFDASTAELNGRLRECDSLEEAKTAAIAIVGWCGKDECAGWLKHNTEKDIIGMTFKVEEKPCLWCKEKGEKTYLSKSY